MEDGGARPLQVSINPIVADFWPAGRARFVLVAIFIVALALRVYRLGSLFPILVDEAIYLRWAEIINHQGQWFISLLDAKQPLSYWLYAVIQRCWGGDPLLGGRMVSAAAGLLSTSGIFAVGQRLCSKEAGLIAAFLYSIFPYALLYDRLAYTDSLVNFFGVAIVYSSLVCFQSTGLRYAVITGLALGLGYFCKSTALLFIFFPALAGIWLDRAQKRRLACRLAAIYIVFLVFPVFSWIALPRAPLLASHNLILHHKGFFITPAEFATDPFKAALVNTRNLVGYLQTYMTIPVTVAALVSLGYLIYQGSLAAVVIASVSVVPLIVQVLILKNMFPTRYAFPHLWPWFVILGMASTALLNKRSSNSTGRPTFRILPLFVFLLLTGPVAIQALRQTACPREYIFPRDAKEFLGSGAFSGFGVRKASDYIRSQARGGPLVLLTDPIWGTPADGFFVYLAGERGIRIHEAWWMKLAPSYPILPPAEMELMKSHYERVWGGIIDFSKVSRVYYATDTTYSPRSSVYARQPKAQLIASFPKPNQSDSIDVYQLK